MGRLTVADELVDALSAFGVKRVFGVVGDSLNGITDAIRRKKNMEWIHTRHEETAAFAAGAEAQLTGELAVCAGSCGPGNLHLINGLFDCHRSQAPVLAIAAHIPSLEIGGDYFQETHPQILFKECSHFCELVSSAEQMPRMLAMAIQTAISKRGVAVLVISGDVALQKLSSQQIKMFCPREPKPCVIPNPEELKKMSDILNQSSRITVFCGHGSAGAHEELMTLCHALKSPMVHALRGKEHVEYANPFDVGMTGFIGFSSGYYAMQDCDTLLMLGTNFPYRQFYPRQARVIQVDIRGENIGRRCPVDIGVVGDVKDTIKALMPYLTPHDDSKFLDKAVQHYKKSRIKLDDLATGKAGSPPIHPQYLAKLVSDMATEDAIFCCDVGTPTVWAARYLQMNGKRRLLGSFNHGSMANALSQAIGAQATYPERQVVALCGDGGFTMLMGDFITLMQQKLPVKTIIFNNGALGFVELEMKATGFLNFGTDLVNPNFADMAEAMGVMGIRVEDPGDLKGALDKALSHPGPVLVDVLTNRFELAIPPSITAEQVKGFTLYMVKAIMNAQGNELFEMAETNLWR